MSPPNGIDTVLAGAGFLLTSIQLIPSQTRVMVLSKVFNSKSLPMSRLPVPFLTTTVLLSDAALSVSLVPGSLATLVSRSSVAAEASVDTFTSFTEVVCNTTGRDSDTLKFGECLRCYWRSPRLIPFGCCAIVNQT